MLTLAEFLDSRPPTPVDRKQCITHLVNCDPLSTTSPAGLQRRFEETDHSLGIFALGPKQKRELVHLFDAFQADPSPEWIMQVRGSLGWDDVLGQDPALKSVLRHIFVYGSAPEASDWLPDPDYAVAGLLNAGMLVFMARRRDADTELQLTAEGMSTAGLMAPRVSTLEPTETLALGAEQRPLMVSKAAEDGARTVVQFVEIFR